MAKSVSIARVSRPDGRLAVEFANHRGVIFSSVADAQAILAALQDALTEEALVVLALKKIGAANAEQLAGKAVTLIFDVSIA